MDDEKKKLKNLKHGRFSRTINLLGMVASSGQKAVKYKIQTTLANSPLNKEKIAVELLTKQITMIAEKFGNLKGGLMKVGQMLSVYGEYFLPPEINKILKSLQYKTTPFEWETLKKILEQNLGEDIFKELDIETEPHAAASLGQVHVAKRKSNNQKIAIKIQYPNVDKAVENDIKALKTIFNFAELFPQISHMDLLFAEVQSMLKQELDYIYEMNWTTKYRKLLLGDSRFIVPEVFPDLTTTRVISTSFEEGVDVDSLEVKGLSQERRNALALNMLDLYFKELFLWGFVQTDPHIGNYKIRLNHEKENVDQIILYDFGAVREFSTEFLQHYRGLIAGALAKDYAKLEEHSLKLKFTETSDPQELKDLFYSFCILMVEPFHPGVYDWSNTDLPKRLTQMVGKVLTQFKVRSPPREVVFLDRKTTGVFIFLSILGAKINAHALLSSYLDEHKN